MLSLLNYRLKVTVQDGRWLIGQLLAFDKHMNLVLGDTEEFRKIRPKGKVPAGAPDKEEKRALGLVVLRGETIVSLSIEASPPSGGKKVSASYIPGQGAGRPAGRGLPMAPPTATPMMGAPMMGLGGPAMGMMQPQVSAAPVQYARPPPNMPPPMMPPPGFRPVSSSHL
jgi:small nuclear ribonucleoprotein B and B'